jgi:hypothetical protein
MISTYASGRLFDLVIRITKDFDQQLQALLPRQVKQVKLKASAFNMLLDTSSAKLFIIDLFEPFSLNSHMKARIEDLQRVQISCWMS